MKKHKQSRIQQAWQCTRCQRVVLIKPINGKCKQCGCTTFEEIGEKKKTTKIELMNKRKPSWCCKKCKAWTDVRPKKQPCSFCLNREYHYFASSKEADHFKLLMLLELAGQITDIETQVPYRIDINGIKICTYLADFRYRTKEGAVIVEDVKAKGSEITTEVFELKRKLVRAIYGIDIKIV